MRLQEVGIDLNTFKPNCFTVRWIAPTQGLALNVDGSSKGNPGLAGGGGCVRDRMGKLILGFAYFYGYGTNVAAEGRALLDGLRLAHHHGLEITVIYSDSKVLIDMLAANKDPPWHLLPWWNQLQQLFLKTHCPLIHTYREANQVADALANYAIERGDNSVFYDSRELPLKARGYALADTKGWPNIRVKL